MSHQGRVSISWYRSREIDNLNNFCFACLIKRLTSEKFRKSTYIDTKSTLQASHKCRRPVFWHRSIDLNKLNNVCSTYLYKIFTSKRLLKSTLIDKKSTLQASHWYRIVKNYCHRKISTLLVSQEAHGSISWYRLIELDKLINFCSIFLYNIFSRKKSNWYRLFSTWSRLVRRAMGPAGLFLDIVR